MTGLVFFYGTLMTPFHRTRPLQLDRFLRPLGRGTIPAVLFDTGMYPAAVPLPDGQVSGEVYAFEHADVVLDTLDDLEGYCPDAPDSSLYRRTVTSVTLEDGTALAAWAYFYNAPLGGAQRIESGDYLAYLRGQ